MPEPCDVVAVDIERGQLQFQVMAPQAALLPERSSLLSQATDLFGSLAGASMTADQIRSNFAATREDALRKAEGMQRVLDEVVGGLVEMLEAGHHVDVQSNIDQLLRFEAEESRDADKVCKVAEGAMKTAARLKPDLLRTLSDSLKDFDTISRSRQEAYRDARWRLMRARALHEPDEPAGPIKGKPMDLDEYAKSAR